MTHVVRLFAARLARAAAASLALGALFLGALLAGCAAVRNQPGLQRLYVMDCGESQIPDVSPWSPGVNQGQRATFSANCYLLRHAKGWLLWDSGYPDAIAALPEGLKGPRGTAFRKKTLQAQLAELGLQPSHITHLAFSHSHGDHVGNANLFTSATLFIQKAEHDAAFGPDAAKFGFQPVNYEKLRDSRKQLLDGDHDVFGDGTVTILATPGHTPGHQSLLLRLPRSGALVLTGDLAHFQQNWDFRRVPAFNFNREQSLVAMEKVDAVLKREQAQLWINHDAAQTARLRMSPQFYE